MVAIALVEDDQLVRRNSYAVTPYRSLPTVCSPISEVDFRIVGRPSHTSYFSRYDHSRCILLSVEVWPISLDL